MFILLLIVIVVAVAVLVDRRFLRKKKDVS